MSEPIAASPAESSRSQRADPNRSQRGLPYLDLAWTLVRTDFKARYHGTIGGFVWALLKPLTMFLSLLAIFSFVFTTEPNYRLKLLVGLFLWDFFAESTRVGVTSLAQKWFLITKAKFPAWIVVVTSTANACLTLTVFTSAILVYLIISGRTPSIGSLLLYLLYVLAFVVLVTGISLATSVLFLRYRDLNQIWDVATQAGFFLTPIIWPIGAVPERYHFFLYLWPPTPYIDFARQVLVANVAPSGTATAYLLTATLFVFGAGVLIHRRRARSAAEYL